MLPATMSYYLLKKREKTEALLIRINNGVNLIAYIEQGCVGYKPSTFTLLF